MVYGGKFADPEKVKEALKEANAFKSSIGGRKKYDKLVEIIKSKYGDELSSKKRPNWREIKNIYEKYPSLDLDIKEYNVEPLPYHRNKYEEGEKEKLIELNKEQIESLLKSYNDLRKRKNDSIYNFDKTIDELRKQREEEYLKFNKSIKELKEMKKIDDKKFDLEMKAIHEQLVKLHKLTVTVKKRKFRPRELGDGYNDYDYYDY